MTLPENWRAIQKSNFTDCNQLLDFLQLAPKLRQKVLIRPSFTLNLPRRLADKIVKNTLDDPILRQFIPLNEESMLSDGFSLDPLDDQRFRKEKKLLHKYQNRVLLVCTSACAMHCRFCFRQNFDYETKDKLFDKELILIENDPSLTEVILSGGDPLSLGNAALCELIQRISCIPHIKRLRFHTRFPIGIPERIDDAFLGILKNTRLQTIFVIHCNHALELDETVMQALKQVQKLGIPVLSQTVLLKGVNDNLNTLQTLFEHLIDQGISPYYLHQLDPVAGAAHFSVEESVGLSLIEQLSAVLPGYGVPKYVKEVPGDHFKRPIRPLA